MNPSGPTLSVVDSSSPVGRTSVSERDATGGSAPADVVAVPSTVTEQPAKSAHALTAATVDRDARTPFAYFLGLSPPASVDSAATNASCGTSTRPMVFIRFLPSFCFSSSLRLRVISPP